MTQLDKNEKADLDGEDDEEPAKRMALICWSSDLDKVWPTLILATTGAASGMEEIGRAHV